MNPNTMMIEAQARRITQLNEEISRLRTENEHLRHQLKRDAVYAEFYRTFQKTLLENPPLLASWQEFIAAMKMHDPDEHKYDKILSAYYNTNEPFFMGAKKTPTNMPDRYRRLRQFSKT
jgi:hypothetical protein